jgi:hypothetical protein
VTGASGYTLAALFFAVAGLAYLVTFHLMANSPSPQREVEILLSASALAFAGILTIPAIAHGARYLLRHKAAGRATRPLGLWQAVGIAFGGAGAALLAGYLAPSSGWFWATPAFFIIATATPVSLMIRAATGGLPGGSPLRVWGSLGTGLWVGTTLAMVMEVLFIGLAAVGLGFFFTLEPGRILELRQLTMQLRLGDSQQASQEIAAMLLQTPWMIALALVLLCGAIPIIEELSKSVTVWLILDRLETPVQGFTVGAFSGGGFAVLESLLGTMQPSPAWSLSLLLRWGTAAMHVLASGIAGWGIARTRANRQPRWAFLAMLLAILLHGLWNFIALLFGFGLSRLGPDPLRYRGTIPPQTLLGAGLMSLLTIGVIVLLVLTNIRLRQQLREGSGT